MKSTQERTDDEKNLIMDVDNLVSLMTLLDVDGDGTVRKDEFGIYYRQLKDLSNEEFEAVWKEMDANGDDELILQELSAYYGVDSDLCAKRKKEQTLEDDRLLELLQLQSLLTESRLKREAQQKAHADRLRALAELADETAEEEEAAAVPSPTSVIDAAIARPGSSLTLQDVIRDSKRRGDLASRFFEPGS